MGAENSKVNNEKLQSKRNEITANHLEQALEKQRKIYEVQTKKLLLAQRAELAKNQAPSVPQNYPPNVVATPNTLYPDLTRTATINNAMQSLQLSQPTTLIPSPSAPSAPNFSLIETQQSASTLPPVPQAGPSYPMRKHASPQLRMPHNNNTAQMCPNWLDGCKLRFEEGKLEAHLLECPFKELSCPINDAYIDCPWKGKINQLSSHFDALHKECHRMKVDTENALHIGHNYRFLQLVEIGTFYFILHLIVEQRTNKIQTAIRLLGSKTSASKWTFEFRIYDKKQPRRLFEYKDTCFSNTDSFDNLCVENKTAVISLDYAKTFAQNDVITYKIFLRKAFMKKEADAKNGNNNYTRNRAFNPRGASSSRRNNN